MGRDRGKPWLASALLLAALASCGPQEAQLTPVVPDTQRSDLLERLRVRSRKTGSTDLIVWHDGKALLEDHANDGQPIRLRSLTKSVMACILGRAIQCGHIASIEEPVHRWFPRWHETPQKAITIRHLMEHSSGIASTPTTRLIRSSKDCIKFALDSQLVDPPGTVFRYNNRATNLLSGILKKATSGDLQTFANKEFFTPLGIDDPKWQTDASGTAYGMSGLSLSATDLLEIGKLMLEDGQLGEQQILPQGWTLEVTRPSTISQGEHGLLWWTIPESRTLVIESTHLEAWTREGVNKAYVKRLSRLQDQEFSPQAFHSAVRDGLGDQQAFNLWRMFLKARKLEEARVVLGKPVGYFGQGEDGQYLIVFPKERLIAIRLIAPAQTMPDSARFPDFIDLLLAFRSAL